MTTQRILLYVISVVMILSLAASFIIGSTSPQAVPVDPATQTETTDGDNLLTDPPTADNEASETATDEEQATDEETVDETQSGQGDGTDSETADETEAGDEETSDSAEEDTSVDGDAAEPDTEN